MNADLFRRARPIFLEVCDLGPQDRDDRLQTCCAGDEELRAAVESLLAADKEPVALDRGIELGQDLTSLFEQDDAARPSTEMPAQIGDFTIIRKIGEGGMGTVFEAEQTSPRRSVALKMIRPDFGGRDLSARFQREIDLLGQLDHPGIARIFHAGTTNDDQGARPYFTMELIDGSSLAKYVKTHDLSIRERVKLFAAICDSVHYAHMRGVVHRDLKPGNIMVTEAGRPVVLDFGVARATGSDIQAVTVTVNAGQIVGTLSYMSPEQASGNCDAIDGRSDVYALGVILYELLVGKLPHDIEGKSIADAALTIRDSQPTRMSRIDRRLRGDLETIVQKAMEKEPQRRYDSAAALAQDLRRFLTDEPIIARPPSAVYELRKFAKRNRALVGITCAASFALVALSIFATSKAVSATEAQRAAESEADRAQSTVAFLSDVLASADPNRSQGEEATVKNVLDEAAARIERGYLSEYPKTLAQLHLTIGRSFLAIGNYDSGRTHLERALELSESSYGATNPIVADHLDHLAKAMTLLGSFDEAENLFLRAKEIRSSSNVAANVTGPAWPHDLAQVYYYTGRYDAAKSEYERAVKTCRDQNLEEKLAESLSGLGAVLEALAEYPEAIAAHREAISIYERLFGEYNTNLANSYNNVGNVLQATGEYEDAATAHRRALAIRKHLLRPDHPDIAMSYANLALVLLNLGQATESESMTREAMKIRESQLPAVHHLRAVTLNNLAKAIQAQGRADEAIGYFDRAVEQSERAMPEGHLMTLALRGNRARCRAELQEFDPAEAELIDCYEKMATSIGPDHRRTQDIVTYLIELYELANQPNDVQIWKDKRTSDGP